MLVSINKENILFTAISCPLYPSIGCFAFWCFPCFACITAREAGECLCLPLLDGFGAIPPATMSMRVGMRQRYGIEVGTQNLMH